MLQAANSGRRARSQSLALALGLMAFALLTIGAAAHGWRMAALALVGLLLGITLYHASFGFANGYRRMFVQRDMRGVQAQLLMLALAVVLFAPVLAAGSVFGKNVSGAWAPVGVSVAAGAFLFGIGIGIGMQLAGGCGSGTLYTAGGGSVRMMAAMAAAIAGWFWDSLHLQWWQGLPALGPVVMGQRLGWTAAAAIQLGVIGLLALVVQAIGRPDPARPAELQSADESVNASEIRLPPATSAFWKGRATL